MISNRKKLPERLARRIWGKCIIWGEITTWNLKRRLRQALSSLPASGFVFIHKVKTPRGLMVVAIGMEAVENGMKPEGACSRLPQLYPITCLR
jgi:hypothetical protein